MVAAWLGYTTVPDREATLMPGRLPALLPTCHACWWAMDEFTVHSALYVVRSSLADPAASEPSLLGICLTNQKQCWATSLLYQNMAKVFFHPHERRKPCPCCLY